MGAGDTGDLPAPPWAQTRRRPGAPWRVAALVAGAALLVWLTPTLILLAMALVHRVTLPPVEPLVVAADRVEAEVEHLADVTVRSTEVDGPSGCSMMNPECPSVALTTLVDAPTLEHAIATVSDAVTAAGFGDVDGSLMYVRDESRCCYLASLDGHEVMVKVTRSYQVQPPAEGEYVEVRVSHLDPTTRSHLDR